MNPFIKSNKPWLSLLGLAVIIVFLGFLFRPKSIDFKVSAHQAVKLMSESQMQVSISGLSGKQLIDIRPADLFAQGHPDQSINIPVRNLLDEESLDFFDQLKSNGTVAVLYGSNELQSTAPLLLLQQLGYPNIKSLKGGWNTDNHFSETAQASSEVSLVNETMLKPRSEMTTNSESIALKKKSENVVPVKKATSSGGGC